MAIGLPQILTLFIGASRSSRSVDLSRERVEEKAKQVRYEARSQLRLATFAKLDPLRELAQRHNDRLSARFERVKSPPEAITTFLAHVPDFLRDADGARESHVAAAHVCFEVARLYDDIEPGERPLEEARELADDFAALGQGMLNTATRFEELASTIRTVAEDARADRTKVELEWVMRENGHHYRALADR